MIYHTFQRYCVAENIKKSIGNLPFLSLSLSFPFPHSISLPLPSLPFLLIFSIHLTRAFIKDLMSVVRLGKQIRRHSPFLLFPHFFVLSSPYSVVSMIPYPLPSTPSSLQSNPPYQPTIPSPFPSQPFHNLSPTPLMLPPLMIPSLILPIPSPLMGTSRIPTFQQRSSGIMNFFVSLYICWP